MATTKKAIRAALAKKGGIIAHAAEELGISRQSLQQRLNRNPDLRAFRIELEETMKDAAEASVFSKILIGDDPRLALDFLAQKARERGYGRQVETRLDDDQFAMILDLLTDGDPAKEDALFPPDGV